MLVVKRVYGNGWNLKLFFVEIFLMSVRGQETEFFSKFSLYRFVPSNGASSDNGAALTASTKQVPRAITTNEVIVNGVTKSFIRPAIMIHYS